MTENEVKETREWLQDFIRMFGCNFDDLETRRFNECVIFLKELEQCRAIGTVEDMAFYKKCYDEESYEYCGEYGTDNCGCKDRMERLEKKIAKFEAIGTIEEFKALKEKESKELEEDEYGFSDYWEET